MLTEVLLLVTTLVNLADIRCEFRLLRLLLSLVADVVNFGNRNVLGSICKSSISFAWKLLLFTFDQWCIFGNH